MSITLNDGFRDWLNGGWQETYNYPNEDAEFKSFGKIPRLTREVVVTEKIDGTNAHILIRPFTSLDGPGHECGVIAPLRGKLYELIPASRTRFIAPGKETDNFGFAEWVFNNADELVKLGVGRHYGEWWGQGIQRGYGLKERRFSLFNLKKWGDDEVRPACCHAVPWLASGEFDTYQIDRVLELLTMVGSLAAPGFMRPEGIVVYHTAGDLLFKKTIEKDEGKDA